MLFLIAISTMEPFCHKSNGQCGSRQQTACDYISTTQGDGGEHQATTGAVRTEEVDH